MVEYFEKAIILYQEGDFCQRSYCDTERIISTPLPEIHGAPGPTWSEIFLILLVLVRF